jgi:hypothetical protein
MAVTTQTDARIFLGAFEFTSFTNQVEWGVDVATQDVSVFGSQFSQFVPGLKTLMFNTSGFNDYAAASLDEYVRTNVGTRLVGTLSNAALATGGSAIVGAGVLQAWRAINAAVGAVPTVQAAIGDGYTAVGQITQTNSAAVTATGNSTPVNVGAVAAGRTIIASVHALTVTGTTPSLTPALASSTTSGGAYTVRATGSAMTAAGSQLITAAGAFTDTWWRLNYTVTGTTPSFLLVAAIAITGP